MNLKDAIESEQPKLKKMKETGGHYLKRKSMVAILNLLVVEELKPTGDHEGRESNSKSGEGIL